MARDQQARDEIQQLARVVGDLRDILRVFIGESGAGARYSAESAVCHLWNMDMASAFRIALDKVCENADVNQEAATPISIDEFPQVVTEQLMALGKYCTECNERLEKLEQSSRSRDLFKLSEEGILKHMTERIEKLEQAQEPKKQEVPKSCLTCGRSVVCPCDTKPRTSPPCTGWTPVITVVQGGGQEAPKFERGDWVKDKHLGSIGMVSSRLPNDRLEVFLLHQRLTTMWFERDCEPALCIDRNGVPIFEGDEVIAMVSGIKGIAIEDGCIPPCSTGKCGKPSTGTTARFRLPNGEKEYWNRELILSRRKGQEARDAQDIARWNVHSQYAFDRQAH